MALSGNEPVLRASSYPGSTRPLAAKRLAIMLPTWVGDACMSTPTLRAIRGRYPDLHITLICRPVIHDLLWGAWGSEPAWADDVMLVSKTGGDGVYTRRELVRALRGSGTDAGILLPNAFWAAAVMKLGGVKRLIGYHRDARGWLLTDKVPVLRQGRQLMPVSAVDYYARLAEWLDAPVHSRGTQLREEAEHAAAAESLLRRLGYDRARQRLLVVNSGSATDAARLWPEASVAELARRAASELGYFVLIHCGPQDREQANRIVQRVGAQHVAGMGNCEHLPIGLSKSMIARAHAVVTTDSGPRHIAVAFDRPVVTLFGPTSPEWTTTYNVPETILQSARGIAGSMSDISVDRVMQAVHDVTDRSAGIGSIQTRGAASAA
jgi:heptosyltransferase II